MTLPSAPSLSLPPTLTKQQLEQLEDAIDARYARESLARFAVRLNPYLDLKPFHHYVIERLEAVERGDIRNLIISIPPRHGKTEMVSVNLPPWILGRDPRAQIILASYGLDLARQNSRAARNKLYEPAWPFPEVAVATDSASVERWGTTAGGSVLAAGVNSRITGFGAHYLIIDDPFIGRESVESEHQRDIVWNWYRSDAITRRMPKGRTIILATRWHQDDLIGRILNQEHAANDWVQINLPAIATADDPIGRQPGEALDPDRYPTEELLKIQAEVGSHNWNSLYQGSPTAEGGDLLKSEWWQRYDYQDLAKKGLVPACIVVDPAYGGGSANDYSCAMVGGVFRGRFYVIDVWRQRCTYVQLRQALGDLYRKWRVPVVIEDVGPGKILLQELRSGASARDDHIAIPTVPFKLPTGSGARGGYMLGKKQRVEMITAFVEGGLVYLPDDARWVRGFVEECADFPGGAHDDQVDALVMFLLRSSGVRSEIKDLFMAPQSYSWGA